MLLYRTRNGPVVLHQQKHYLLNEPDWDALISRENPLKHVQEQLASAPPMASLNRADLLPPIGTQEVWAAGVTYYRSRDARMEESKDAGGGTFYDRVYSAQRPELFFKSPAYRVVGPNQPVRIRRDSKWNVPEPELTLVISSRGRIIGYTIGNDMSSRDIEGENPLYLPQAKVYDGSCAVGPAILLSNQPLPKSTCIAITIERGGANVFEGDTTLAELKRDPQELVEFLYRETTFPAGCLLMTGTGIVPSNNFTLAHGDRISISIDSIGTLTNFVQP